MKIEKKSHVGEAADLNRIDIIKICINVKAKALASKMGNKNIEQLKNVERTLRNKKRIFRH